MKKVAKKLEKAGRKGDTLLAHINHDEAMALKAMGGSGTKNPKTGLLEFYEGDGPLGGGDVAEGGYGGDYGGMSAGDVAQFGEAPVANYAGLDAAMAGPSMGGTAVGDAYNWGGPSMGVYGGSATMPDGTTVAGGAQRTELGRLQDWYSDPENALGRILGGLFGYGANRAISATGAGWTGGNNAGGLLAGSDRADRGGAADVAGGGGTTPVPPWLPPATPRQPGLIRRPTLTSKWGQPRGLLG